MLKCGHYIPKELWLQLVWITPDAYLLIFKRKHIISRVESGFLRKISKSQAVLIKLTGLVRVNSVLLTVHQLEGCMCENKCEM